MKLAAAPLTQPQPGTPAVAAAFVGVAIAAARVPLRGELVQIDGLFRLPPADAEAIGRPLHRALSCSAWANTYQDSLDPFRDIVLFPDDETEAGGAIQGYFSFQFPMYRGAGLYLHVALGPYLSDSVPSPP
ncbi:MAG TPA: hypothetical protein VFH68_16310 [Polyangia bacterium]|nr:hypothetical protein [Polyangia bacterium]